jgi:hypothetical protein
VDVLNLDRNTLETHPVSDVVSPDYPGAHLIASVNKGDYVQPMLSLLDKPDPRAMVLTFDNLIARTDFVPLTKSMLQTIERHYGRPVDVEFAVRQLGGRNGSQVEITLLQCRPLSYRQTGQAVQIPTDVPDEARLFTANRLVPQGVVSDVRYIIWVDPTRYDQIADPVTKTQVGRVVGQLNQVLEGQKFILMGPGRWGSSNLNLGVKVSYADIDHASALIEVALSQGGDAPEASYGTHFFQDLVEAEIYPLPLYPDDRETFFNWRFFEEAPNALTRLLQGCADHQDHIKVIDTEMVAPGKRAEIVMNGEEERALGYLKPGPG